MTTIYKFRAGYTKLGIATAPSSAPTVTVVDADNNVLVNAQATTALTNIAGLYIYSYTGADNLDLTALFHTTDVTMDAQDMHSNSYDSLILATISIEAAPLATAAAVGTVQSVVNNIDSRLPTVPASASDVVSYVAVTAANAATLAAGNVAFLSYAHTSQVITSTSTEDLSSATKVWFALKDSYLETDAQSLIFIEKTAGLTHVGKSAIVSPIVTIDGSLTVGGSSGAWTFTVVLKSEAAAYLSEYTGSGKLGEIKATIGGLDKIIGTVTGAINSGVIRTNA